MQPSWPCCVTALELPALRPATIAAVASLTASIHGAAVVSGVFARWLRVACCALSLAAPLMAAAQTMRGVALIEERVALVIGNATYKHFPLDNPVNDARLIASRLTQAGFKVALRENLDRAGMLAALREFGSQLNENTVAVLFYAGHGLQLRDHNFLIPVDAEIRTEGEIPIQGMDLSFFLDRMSQAKSRVNIVILDACRDNPFARRFRSAARGLAFMDAPTGTYVAYATAPGSVASDGEPGKNGIYTGELLKALREPGLRIEDVFKRVRAGVLAQTNQRQNPWDASSLTGDFYFNLRTASLAPAPAPAAPPKGEIREEIRQELGSLALSARIDGVEVFLDDQKIGEARRGRALVVENLAVGTYRLKARKAGHKDWERDIQVAANQRA